MLVHEVEREESFEFLSWSDRSGSFEQVELPALAGGRSWDVTSLYQEGRIRTVPEPAEGAAWLAAIATLASLPRRQTAAPGSESKNPPPA